MIIALRSAIICDQIEEKSYGADYLGICGGTVRAQSRPGFLQFYLAIQLELDRQPTAGFIQVTAADYDQCFPIQLSEGHWLPAIALQLIVPALSEGKLNVSVHDAAGYRDPIVLQWDIGFTEDAEHLDEGAGLEFIETAENVAALLKARLNRKGFN